MLLKIVVKNAVFSTLEQFYETKEKFKLGKKNFSGTNIYLPPLIQNSVQDLLSYRKGDVSFSIYDQKNNETYHFNNEKKYKAASSVKVSIMMAALRKIRLDDLELTDEIHSKFENMIKKSDNDDTTWLWNFVGRDEYMQSFFNDLGLKDTTAGKNGYWGLTETTSSDQTILLTYLISDNDFFTKEEKEYTLKLMKEVVPSQKWGVSFGSNLSSVSLKNGWIPKKWNAWRLNSIGVVQTETKHYVISVLTDESPTKNYGVETIQKISQCVYDFLD